MNNESNNIENNLDNEDLIINNEKQNEIDYGANTKLPKLRFFDFIFNNIYCKKCCSPIKKQQLIDSCDEILYKYISVENILKNQLLFKHLMKDYHWNNPKLKNIHENKYILEVKKILNDNKSLNEFIEYIR